MLSKTNLFIRHNLGQFSARLSLNLLSSPPGLGGGLGVADPRGIVLNDRGAGPGRVAGPGWVASPGRVTSPGWVVLDDVRGRGGGAAEEDGGSWLLAAALEPLVERI